MTGDQHRNIGEQIAQLNEASRRINERADELAQYHDRLTRVADAVKRGTHLDRSVTWPTPGQYHEAESDLDRLTAHARARCRC